MNHLAILLERRGEAAAAERWYRRAVAADHGTAMYNLAVRLEARGALDEAEAWFRRSASGGNPHALYAVARLLHKQGKAEEAEIWLRRAVAGVCPGYPRSANPTSGGPARGPRSRLRTRDSACCPRF
ncbi:tetratricopeptide repeat protein [Nocardia sienata]|uniref:tetratricopeptide repeat protein n=1 Tax=Nocardia sienata TaxID=248552 RepID=UPI00350E55AE